jgi:hypothetical protein
MHPRRPKLEVSKAGKPALNDENRRIFAMHSLLKVCVKFWSGHSASRRGLSAFANLCPWS